MEFLPSSRRLAIIPSHAPTDDPQSARGRKRLWRAGLIGGASVAVIAAIASAVTFAAISRPQAARFAESAEVTQTLAKSLAALTARLDAIDNRPGGDLADLRRAIGDAKSSSSRDLDAALGQLSKRIDSLDHASSAKFDELGQRAERDSGTRAADITARLDRLEKKVEAATDAKILAPETKPAATPPKLGPNVSMETTGAIERPRATLRGYVVLGAGPQGALLGSRWGEEAVRIGDVLPGAGRVERIERRGPNWVVETEAGLIRPAEPPGF